MGAFENCTSLQAVEFPSWALVVGGSAFARDTSLHCLSGILPRVYPSNTFYGSRNSYDTCNPSPSTTLICQFGSGCASDGDCVAGNKCAIQNAYYSQCIADSNVYANSSATQCLGNHDTKCAATAACCDPGAYCDLTATYSQCKQPTPPNCLISRSDTAQPVLSPTRTPTYTPTASPGETLIPTVVPSPVPTAVPGLSSTPTTVPTDKPSLTLPKRICQYGGYCRKDGDCVSGNRCNIVNQYYSQCLPDTTQYLNSSTCLSTYGAQCDANSVCCDPGGNLTFYFFVIPY